jgi:Protein of unknown function (DUF3224)
MTEIMETKFKIASWDEQPYREFDDGRRFTRASVVLTGPDDGPAAASFDALMYYAADGTSTFVTLMQITGNVGGRSGSFVLQGQGTYDGQTARGESFVVAGSGTGELAGISGTGASASTHDDYPYMPFTLKYVIE